MITNQKWTSIKVFSLESMTGNSNLYSNGRQSIPVRVAIQVTDINGSPIPLSDSELKSLKLLNFHDSTAIPGPITPSSEPVDKNYSQWDWSYEAFSGFRFFPSSSRQSIASMDGPSTKGSAHTYYIEVYLRTISPLRFTLMAQIRRDDGELFDPGKTAHGTLLLDPVRPPTYRALNYFLEETLIKESPRTYYYRFGLFTEGKNIEFWLFNINPWSLLGWPDKAFLFVTVTGYTYPGEAEIRYSQRPPRNSLPWRLELTPEQGQPVIVRVDVPVEEGDRFANANKYKKIAKSSIFAIDVYGNEHHTNLRFIDGDAGGKIELI